MITSLELVGRSLGIEHQAHELVQDYDLLQGYTHYHETIDDEYSLSLRTGFSHRATNPMATEDDRYIYVKQFRPELASDKHCGHAVAFSLRLNALLMPETKRNGLTNQWMVHIPEVLKVAEEGTLTHQLFRGLFQAMPDVDAERDISPDTAQMLELAYEGLIAGGTTEAIRDARKKPSEKETLTVRERTLEGTPGHHTISEFEPRMEVTLHDDSGTRLRFYRDARHGYETMVEPSKAFEAEAAGCEEEDIYRNEAGDIIGLTTYGPRIREVKDAGRAFGLRDLRDDYLRRLEAAFAAIK